MWIVERMRYPTDQPVNGHFTCDTRNVIYALTCPGCGDNYIGKTEREVRDRCGVYRLAIEKKKDYARRS